MFPEVHHELLTSFRFTSASVVGVNEDLKSYLKPFQALFLAARHHTSLAIVLAKAFGDGAGLVLNPPAMAVLQPILEDQP